LEEELEPDLYFNPLLMEVEKLAKPH